MGIQGLHNYVEKNKLFFKEVKLRNSKIIIDGINLSCSLYFNYKLDLQHGGDYNSFSDLARRFFEALSICKIQPFVVLDGGVDFTDKKFETLKQRGQNKIKEAYKISRGFDGMALPTLTKEVFKQVLSSLGVPFVQCMAEADWEIASLANQWNCGVLSMDSDFCIFDLKGGYFPIAHLQWENIRMCSETLKKYIPAKCFSKDNFCAYFNNMNKELLPLFAAMAGNDYIKLPAMEKFFSKVNLAGDKTSYLNTAQARIDGLLHWLSRFSGPEEALEEVLKILEGTDSVRHLLFSAVEEYKLSASNIAQFFTKGALLSNIPEPIKNLPEWILKAMAKGLLSAFIIDVLVLERTRPNVQVENFQLHNCNTTSVSIRQVLYGLLLDWKQKSQYGVSLNSRGAHTVEEYCRVGFELKTFPVQALTPKSSEQWSLERLNEAPWTLRLEILLDTLGVEHSLLRLVPAHFSLPVCVTCYWLSHCKPKPNLQHLQALLLGMVYGKLCRLTGSEQGSPGLQSTQERLDQMRMGREPWGPDVDVAHIYTQWLSCLWTSFHLNQLLCSPLPKPVLAELYCGTLVHGLVKKLRGGVTPEALLEGSPLHGQIFRDLLGAVRSSVGADVFPSAENTRAQRKKQQWHQEGSRGSESDAGLGRVYRSEESAEPVQGLNDRFAKLMQNEECEEMNEKEMFLSQAFHIRARHKAKTKTGKNRICYA